MGKVAAICGRLKNRTDRFGKGTVCWVHKDQAIGELCIKVIAGRVGSGCEVLDLLSGDLECIEVRHHNYKGTLRWTGSQGDAIALALTLVNRGAEAPTI